MAIESGRIFDQVVGHKATIEKLQGLVAANRMPHSLLFVGAPGIGKKTVAYGLAQVLMCDKSPAACGVCPPCKRVALRQSESVTLLQPEKGQIKIEAARAAIQQLALASWNGARMVIIDDAHLLNPQAANALLKSIEEPPPQTYFVLLSSSQENVLKTLRSRSQVVRFRNLSRTELTRLERVAIDVEMRAAALDVWRELLAGHTLTAIDLARENIDTRDKALQATQFWLQFTRDQWFLARQIGPLTHDDLKFDFEQAWQAGQRGSLALDEVVLGRLSEGVLRLERDLTAHADLQLSLENFFRQSGAPA